MSWSRRASWFFLALVLPLAPLSAWAQIAPTGGQYGARASDTGFEGSVNAQGSYSTSVPLELPPARAGLPVPLHIVYTGHGVGAAGLGWEVPLSYILRDQTFSRRRPTQALDLVSAPVAREQLTLMLDGRSMNLVRKGGTTSTVWVPQTDGPQIEVHDLGSGSFVVYDGNGLSYSFSAEGGAAGTRLVNGNLSLLRNVTGRGNTVHLEYRIRNSDFNDTPLVGTLTIDLTRVRYNTSPANQSCFKNEMILGYITPAYVAVGTPLSRSLMQGVSLGRTFVLSTVDVYSRATCSESAQRVRRYNLQYPTPDPDTQLPRLASVMVEARAGSSEKAIKLATYTYGTATSPGSGGGRLLHYARTQTQALPAEAPENFIAIAGETSVGTLPGTDTWMTMLDLTGDGRPDFIYPAHDDAHTLKYVPNLGSPTGFGLGAIPLSHAVFGADAQRPIESQAGPTARFTIEDGHRDYVWRQAIDFNGDGRVDILDAQEKKGSWVLYLNSADEKPNEVHFRRIELLASNVLSRLTSRGYHVDGDSGYMPLSSRVTGRLQDKVHCYKYLGGPASALTSWEHVNGHDCDIPVIGGVEVFNDGRAYGEGPEKTFTEWELRDLNGDGFPDLIFNSGPMTIGAEGAFVPPDLRTLVPPNSVGGVGIGAREEGLVFPSTDTISVLLNSAGTRLDDSAPENLHLSSPVSVRVGTTCGVGAWVEVQAHPGGGTLDDPGHHTPHDRLTQQTCGFADINGDGLTDRIEGQTVYLQNGKLGVGGVVGFGTIATMSLPGVMSVQNSLHNLACAQLGTSLCTVNSDCSSFPGSSCRDNICTTSCFTNAECGQGEECSDSTCIDRHYVHTNNPNIDYIAQRQAALRDLNGDGIPDYITINIDNNGPAQVRFGTGTGFAPPVLIDGEFTLSLDTEDCFGNHALASVGLFDFDGDGKADVVGRQDADLAVSQLMAGSVPGTPEAGRLVQIDNGFGAKTKITYGSAKAESLTPHAVPFPEIVVTAVETVDDSQSPVQTLVQETQYAYGTPELVHNALFDRFVSSGYRRTVKLQKTNGSEGMATISDTYPLVDLPSDGTTLSHTERLARALRAGRPSDVSVLSGFLGDSAQALLSVDITSDPRIIGSTHYVWNARLFEETPGDGIGDIDCVELFDPIEWFLSLQAYSYNPCTAHGFAFQSSVDSWRGDPGAAPPSANNVRMHTDILEVDDLGRAVKIASLGDAARQDDDLVTQFIYPTKVDSLQALNVPLDRKVMDASETSTYSEELWLRNRDGQPLRYRVARMDEFGNPLEDVFTVYDATYDANDILQTTTATREDGATRTVTTHFDDFGMAPDSITITATGGTSPTAPQQITMTRDLNLNLVSATDANGTKTGATYDGFDRALLSTVTPAGGVEGAQSSARYLGFAIGETGGRRIEKTLFTELVDLKSAPSAPGRKSTVFLDQLGREQNAVVELGADYQGQTLISGLRSYDTLGRVVFQADPFPASQASQTAYGTTHYFNTDGTRMCSIRGNGPQPFTMTTDEAHEVYPTCFGRGFTSKTEIHSMKAADSLGSGAQAGVTKSVSLTATGRLLSRDTWQNVTMLEAAVFGYDHLGRLTAMSRFQDPGTFQHTVTTGWHYDSLGQLTALQELPGNAPRFRSYNHWGELTDEQWTDNTISPAVNHHSLATFDALGRMVHREEQKNGVTDAETVNDYRYDEPVNTTGPVTVNPTFVKGRLAQAISPTQAVSFSYDGLGRLDAQVFTDEQQLAYVERHSYHGDGSPSALDLFLPDNIVDDQRSDSGFTYRDEQVSYGYDSAKRVRSVQYSDGLSSESLFQATSIDAFGRVRQAQYGNTSYAATYADAGRRLVRDVSFSSPAAAGKSRKIAFTAPFDPLGRERSREESVDGDVATTTHGYDALGRLVDSRKQKGTNEVRDSFFYDPLGNIVELFDSSQNAHNAVLLYTGDDRDRICRVNYGFDRGTDCNLTYDGVGNVTAMPTFGGAKRSLDYLASGQVRTISDDAGNSAHYQYDGFGNVQQLDLTSPVAAHTRQDRHYGDLIERRQELVDGTLQSVITRSIPGPEGFIAVRHGTTDTWVFGFGEGKGNRFFSDQNGNFVQDVSYAPYGEPTSTGATPHSPLYSSAQWNGGDALEALGVSQLGARIYDPVIGRFLSRDPLFIPRTGATTNPYAFAANDPVNLSDPTGLDFSDNGNCTAKEVCPGLEPLPGGPDFLPFQLNDGFEIIWNPTFQEETAALLNTFGAKPWERPWDREWVKNEKARNDAWDQHERPTEFWGVKAVVWWANECGGPCRTIDAFLWVTGVVGAFEGLASWTFAEAVGYAAGKGVATAASPLLEAELGATVAEDAANLSRHVFMTDAPLGGAVSRVSRFSGYLNEAGGEVFGAAGNITQEDFAALVESGLAKGDVHILTAIHGAPDGSIVFEPRFYLDDLERFGNLPGVHVHDVTKMTPSEIAAVLQKPGTIIGGFCNSAACLRPLR